MHRRAAVRRRLNVFLIGPALRGVHAAMRLDRRYAGITLTPDLGLPRYPTQSSHHGTLSGFAR
jgi:hypothetical protein